MPKNELEIHKKIENDLLENKLEEDKKKLLEEMDSENINEILKEIDKPINIPMSIYNDHLMIDNPLKNSNYITTNEDNYKTNVDLTIRTKDNKLAADILNSGSFSLEDKDIQLKQNNLNDLYFSTKDFATFSAGDVNVFDKNTIFIDDLDINEIPKDINIELDEKKKEIYFVGKKVDCDETENEENIEKIDKDIFVEERLEEKLWKKINFFENILLLEFKRSTIKSLVKYLPFVIFFLATFDTLHEVYEAKKSVNLIDEEKMIALENLKAKFY